MPEEADTPEKTPAAEDAATARREIEDELRVEDPIRIHSLTSPCQAFLGDTYELVRYDELLQGMADKLDKLEGKPVRDADREDGIANVEAFKASIPFTYSLGEFVLLRSEMYCARLVESFLTYLSELLALVFTSNPVMFQTDQVYNAKFILEFASMEDLRAAMVERKVTSLAMESLSDLGKYFKKVFNFDLFANPYEAEAIQELIEIRNLVVHNRAIVNRTYRKNTGRQTPLGERMVVGQDTLIYAFSVLIKSALRIDLGASAKFSLPTTSFDLPALQAQVGRSSLLFRLHPQNFPGSVRKPMFGPNAENRDRP